MSVKKIKIKKRLKLLPVAPYGHHGNYTLVCHSLSDKSMIGAQKQTVLTVSNRN